MSAIPPSSPQRTDSGRPIHIPRLSYRNATPSLPSSPTEFDAPQPSISTRTTLSSTNIATSVPSTSTLPPPCQDGMRIPQQSVTSAPSAKPATLGFKSLEISKPSTVTKKRGSFLLKLLSTREPSTAAFAQMEENLKKQQAADPNGRINPAGMPGVSSTKMPLKVPKVNSKWNGLPSGPKEKQQQDKNRHSRGYSSSGSVRSRSAEPDYRNSRDRRLSDSTLSSFDSRGGGSSDRYRTSHGNRSESTCSFTGIDFAERHGPPSIKSPSLKSPSGYSISDTPSKVVSETLELPEHFRFPHCPRDQITPSPTVGERTASAPPIIVTSGQRYATSGTDFLSPKSPTDLPPATPLPVIEEISPMILQPELPDRTVHSKNTEEILVRSSGTGVLPLPAVKASNIEYTHRLLTGEKSLSQPPNQEPESGHSLKAILRKADRRLSKRPSAHFDSSDMILTDKQVEARPDSSRGRLGLQANVSRSTAAAPWEEWQNLDLKALRNSAYASDSKPSQSDGASPRQRKTSKLASRANLDRFCHDNGPAF